MLTIWLFAFTGIPKELVCVAPDSLLADTTLRNIGKLSKRTQKYTNVKVVLTEIF